MSRRRKVLGVWALLSAFWAIYVLAQPPSYAGYNEGQGVFALLPPILSLLVGFVFTWVWQAHANVYWLRVPQHIRRGLLRLYLVLSVPWAGWFALQILVNGPRWRHFPHALLSLLIVPVGAPVASFLIYWVVVGFQKSGRKFDNSRSTSDHPPSGPTPDAGCAFVAR
jgi:hypothetical protein